MFWYRRKSHSFQLKALPSYIVATVFVKHKLALDHSTLNDLDCAFLARDQYHFNVIFKKSYSVLKPA